MDKSEIQFILLPENIASICKDDNGDKICEFKRSILTDAFDSASNWYETLTPDICRSKTKKELTKDLKKYIDTNGKFRTKPYGFVASILWMMIAQAVIAWVIRKIIEYIIEHYIINH